jgi:hypothetical protein
MIRIGPAGWHYKDWQGLVYPNPEPRGFRELAYLATLFNVVGKAVVNAAVLEALLGQPAPGLPAALLERYPEFREIVTNPTGADSSAG